MAFHPDVAARKAGIAVANISGSEASAEPGVPLNDYLRQPFDPNRPLNRSGCVCGRHQSQPEHDHEAALTMQCEPVPSQSEDKRYEGVAASAVMRAVFPKDAARCAFLKSAGVSTALVAISQFFPLKTATDARACAIAQAEETI